MRRAADNAEIKWKQNALRHSFISFKGWDNRRVNRSPVQPHVLGMRRFGRTSSRYSSIYASNYVRAVAKFVRSHKCLVQALQTFSVSLHLIFTRLRSRDKHPESKLIEMVGRSSSDIFGGARSIPLQCFLNVTGDDGHFHRIADPFESLRELGFESM
jgi:hypothetical protein